MFGCAKRVNIDFTADDKRGFLAFGSANATILQMSTSFSQAVYKAVRVEIKTYTSPIDKCSTRALTNDGFDRRDYLPFLQLNNGISAFVANITYCLSSVAFIIFPSCFMTIKESELSASCANTSLSLLISLPKKLTVS